MEIGVYVLHSQRLYADALGRAIDLLPGFTCVGVGDSTNVALGSGHPVLFLVDIELLSRDAFHTLSGLKQRHPGSPVMVVGRARATHALIAKGASAVIDSTGSLDDIHRCVLSILKTQAPCLLNRQTAPVRNEPADPFTALSRKERETLELLSRGLAPKDVAIAMNVTPQTVSTHISRICEKLGVTGRQEALFLKWRWDARHKRERAGARTEVDA